MNKLLLTILSIGLLLGACASNTSEEKSTEENTSSEEEKQVDKTAQRKEFKAMPAEEAIQKFGLDFEKNIPYDGYYEYYMKNDQEVLHGAFELVNEDDMDTYLANNAKAGMSDDDQFGVMHSYVKASYKGQFKDGKKNGVFSMDATYYEGAGKATITFDAEKNTCTNATYKGGAEGYCFEFDRTIPDCKFGEITNHTKEVECDY